MADCQHPAKPRKVAGVRQQRVLHQVPKKLGPAAVIAEAKKRIGTDINGIILTQELFDEKFANA